ELTDEAMNTDAKTLSSRINATVRSAIAQATRDQLKIVQTQVGEDIDPLELLGPQAKFAEFSETVEEAPLPPVTPEEEDDTFDDILSHSSSTPSTPVEEEEPMSESDRFLRNLQG